MEIIVILLGIIVFIISFLLPAGKKSSEPQIQQIDEEAIRELVEREMKDAKSKIGDIVDETITYAMEKTERSMDRLTNEKMLAVNEYSDTVLEEINKNHKEVVFLYDMLNDKHENLKSTVTEAAKKVNEVKQTVKDAEAVAKEAMKDVVKETVQEPAVEAVVVQEPERERIQEQKIPQETQQIKEADVPETKPENIEEEVDFTPIAPRKVEVIYQPTEEYDVVKTEEEPKKKSSGKGRASKASKKTGAAEASDEVKKPKMTAPAETSEIEVTLNAAGRTGGRNSNERILELHKAGKSNMAIAKELGLGIGEVKLVIDLFEGL